MERKGRKRQIQRQFEKYGGGPEEHKYEISHGLGKNEEKIGRRLKKNVLFKKLGALVDLENWKTKGESLGGGDKVREKYESKGVWVSR